MSLRERYARLEERERRLLGILIVIVVAALLLAPPLALIAVVHSHRSGNEEIEQAISAIAEERMAIAKSKAERSAIVGRYGKPAPPLASFLAKLAADTGVEIPESQDRQSVPHGKKFDERSTKISLRKVGMLKLAKFMERIEQSGHPVSISQLNIHKREADSYDVDMVVSAFDRKEPKEPKDAAKAKPEGSASPDDSSDATGDEP